MLVLGAQLAVLDDQTHFQYLLIESDRFSVYFSCFNVYITSQNTYRVEGRLSGGEFSGLCQQSKMLVLGQLFWSCHLDISCIISATT
jgi:hypothetical protein